MAARKAREKVPLPPIYGDGVDAVDAVDALEPGIHGLAGRWGCWQAVRNGRLHWPLPRTVAINAYLPSECQSDFGISDARESTLQERT